MAVFGLRMNSQVAFHYKQLYSKTCHLQPFSGFAVSSRKFQVVSKRGRNNFLIAKNVALLNRLSQITDSTVWLFALCEIIAPVEAVNMVV